MAKKAEPEPVPTTIELGGIPVETGTEAPDRMALLLWGAAGVGKTTFAATAPGDKLWLSFGDNEHVTVAGRKDVFSVPLYKQKVEDLFKHGKSENPFGLDKFLADNENIGTVVVDSATALSYSALLKAVNIDKQGASRSFTPTMEAPGIAAYGGRNGATVEVLSGILRVTAKYNVHCIICAHEDDPTMMQVQGPSGSQQEVIDYIGIMLGGKITNQVTYRLSEIWFMSQQGNQRSLMIRPSRKRKPCKTRMFQQVASDGTPAQPEFELDYDPDKPDKGQMTIASFYDQWLDGGKVRIPVPKVKQRKK